MQSRDDRLLKAKKRRADEQQQQDRQQRAPHIRDSDAADNNDDEEQQEVEIPRTKRSRRSDDQGTSEWPHGAEPVGFGNKIRKGDATTASVAVKSTIEDVFPSRRGRGGKML